MDQERANTSPYNINRLVLRVEMKWLYFKVRPPVALLYLYLINKYKTLTQLYCSNFKAKCFDPKGYHEVNTSCASLAPSQLELSQDYKRLLEKLSALRWEEQQHIIAPFR